MKTTLWFVQDSKLKAMSSSILHDPLDGLEMTVLRTKDLCYYADKKYIIYDEETKHLRVGNGSMQDMEDVGSVRVVKSRELLPEAGRTDTLYVVLEDGSMHVWDDENFEWYEIKTGGTADTKGLVYGKTINLTIPKTGWVNNPSMDFPKKNTIKDSEIVAGAIPDLVFYGTDFDNAINTGIAPYCSTEEGSITVYASKESDVIIKGVLTLFDLKRGATTAVGATNACGSIKKPAEKVSVPTQKGSLIYNGKALLPEWDGYDNEKIILVKINAQTDAGEYEAVFAPQDGFVWSDGSTSERKVFWTISRAKIKAPYARTPSLSFTGKDQDPGWVDYDEKKVILSSGDLKASNVGQYEACFEPDRNYTWEDGSSGSKSVKWSIGKTTVRIPKIAIDTFTYNAEKQSISWSVPPESEKCSCLTPESLTGVNAGTYKITIELKDPSGYVWEDGTNDILSILWKIEKMKLPAYKLVEAQKIYNGNFQTVAWSPAIMNDAVIIQGTPKASDVGTYKAVLHLINNNYAWNDGTTADKEYTWSIKNKVAQIPKITDRYLYDIKTHSAAFADSNHEGVTLSCESKLAVGTYTYTLKLVKGYEWPDGSTSDKQGTWEIYEEGLEIPVMYEKSAKQVYNGDTKAIAWVNYAYGEDGRIKTDKIVASISSGKSTFSAEDAGDYFVHLIPATGYKWKDGTREVKTYAWKIDKAEFVMSNLDSTYRVESGKQDNYILGCGPKAAQKYPHNSSSYIRSGNVGDGTANIAIHSTINSTTKLYDYKLTVSGDKKGTAYEVLRISGGKNFKDYEKEVTIIVY